MVHAVWDLSNENLWVEESRLTYFTVRDTPELQMKQEKGKKKKENCFFSSYRTKSFPVYTALVDPSGEWHFLRPAVKHGLIHMQTNTNGQNAHKCLDPCGSLCFSHSHTGALSHSHALPPCVATAHHYSGKLLWMKLTFDMTCLWVQIQY